MSDVDLAELYRFNGEQNNYFLCTTVQTSRSVHEIAQIVKLVLQYYTQRHGVGVTLVLHPPPIAERRRNEEPERLLHGRRFGHKLYGAAQ